MPTTGPSCVVSEDRASRGKFAWQKVVDEAGLTGMYRGWYTMPTAGVRHHSARGGADAGAATLARAEPRGSSSSEPRRCTSTTRGSDAGAGTQTQTAQEQRYPVAERSSGLANKQQRDTANQYLTLLSQCAGPRLLPVPERAQPTPGGMRDLVVAMGSSSAVAPRLACSLLLNRYRAYKRRYSQSMAALWPVSACTARMSRRSRPRISTVSISNWGCLSVQPDRRVEDQPERLGWSERATNQRSALGKCTHHGCASERELAQSASTQPGGHAVVEQPGAVAAAAPHLWMGVAGLEC